MNSEDNWRGWGIEMPHSTWNNSNVIDRETVLKGTALHSYSIRAGFYSHKVVGDKMSWVIKQRFRMGIMQNQLLSLSFPPRNLLLST